jgi:hypothetical protein
MSAVTAEAAAYVVSKKYMSSYYDTTSKNVFKNSDYDRLYLPRTNHKSNIEDEIRNISCPTSSSFTSYVNPGLFVYFARCYP